MSETTMQAERETPEHCLGGELDAIDWKAAHDEVLRELRDTHEAKTRSDGMVDTLARLVERQRERLDRAASAIAGLREVRTFYFSNPDELARIATYARALTEAGHRVVIREHLSYDEDTDTYGQPIDGLTVYVQDTP